MKNLIIQNLKNNYVITTHAHAIRRSLSALLFCASLGTMAISSSAQTINTFAGDGTGTPGNTGNAGPATAGGTFVTPKYVAADGSGNVYMSSPPYNTVRLVSGGIIDVFAGNGSAGWSGDYGPASIARLTGPTGVATDAVGKVYICDAGNQRIRYVSGGIIYPFAGTGVAGFSPDGTPAMSANINNPDGIVVDGAGNVYFSDQANNVVRMIDLTGKIYTVAGNGASGYSGDGGPATNARITAPAGLAINGSTLYIADPTSHVIRMVNMLGTTSGTIYTYLGTGTAGSSGDCSYASSADLDAPTGLAFDPLGNFYISDVNAHKVRVVNTYNKIRTFAGSGTYSYTGDGGDATAASMEAPEGVAVDGSGNVYICDDGPSGNAVRIVNSASLATPILPSTPDQYWYSTPDIKGVNVASIAYNGPSGPGTLFGSNYYDGAVGVNIFVKDLAVGNAAIPVPYPISIPDIVIGNVNGSKKSICPGCTPKLHYILAAAYVNTTSKVQIDFYDVLDDPFSLTLNINPIPGTSKIIGGYQPGTVHIDLIADPNIMGITGRPFCNKYVVTFDDYNSGSPNIYAAYGDLNLNTLTVPVMINPIGVNGLHPDVSAVRRGAFDDVGLITYTEAGGNALYYQDYDFTSGTLSPLTTLDNGSTSSAIRNPRIDAYDDPAISSLPGVSQYKVVAEVQNCAYTEARSYDNTMGGSYYTSSDNVDISGLGGGYSLYHPFYNHFTPTVAVGANGGNDYNVQHYTEFANTTNSDILFMEPIDMFSPFGLSTGSYYWVNSAGGIPQTGEFYFPNAICTPVNDISLNTLNVWPQLNPGGTAYDIMFKLPTTVYGFKQPKSTAVAGVDTWQIYPNPATDWKK